MLFHKVESQISVLAKRIICLLGECKVGIVKSVMFGISNLIFQLSRIFTWVVLGRDANSSRLPSLVTERKKKSEPLAYRLWVRISTVWCG